MEIRGGNGYVEDWVNAKLVRDAHLGVLWEGTSNINALDITTRAIAKVGAHRDLEGELLDQLERSDAMPGQFKGQLSSTIVRAIAFAEEVASSGNEPLARKAAGALYNATTATLLAREGASLGASGGDARRLLLARLVIDHRIQPQDPLAIDQGDFELDATDVLLSDAPLSLDRATELLAR